jgi:hypothetical protein
MAIKCNSLVSQDCLKVQGGREKFDWAISLANANYEREFNGMFKVLHCIDMSLLFDATIMIVGRSTLHT